MTANDDLGRRLAEHYAAEAPSRAPEWVLGMALATVESMPQRRASLRVPRRLSDMNVYARLAAAGVVVALGFTLFGVALPLVGTSPTVTPSPSVPSPSPSPTPTPTANATVIADRLIAAWNAGDGQRAATLYASVQYPVAPLARFFVDSADATGSYLRATNIASGVTAWHEQGAVLTRTGDVLTQGSYAAFPVSWTSADGSFDGVEVIRLSADGLVGEQELIGAAASASAPSSSPDMVTFIDQVEAAQNASNGSAAPTLYAPDVHARVFRGGALSNSVDDRSQIASAIDRGTACVVTRTGGVETQGPFVVVPTVFANATYDPGREIEGFNVFELNVAGRIQNIWDIGQYRPLPDPAPPSVCGG